MATPCLSPEGIRDAMPHRLWRLLYRAVYFQFAAGHASWQIGRCPLRAADGGSSVRAVRPSNAAAGLCRFFGFRRNLRRLPGRGAAESGATGRGDCALIHCCCILQSAFPAPVLGEMPGRTAAAGAAFEGPAQCFFADWPPVIDRGLQLPEPIANDLQIVVLAERVKRQPEAEAIGEGDFFFHRFARMNFTALVVGLQVFIVELRQQVASVGGEQPIQSIHASFLNLMRCGLSASVPRRRWRSAS